MLEMRLKKSNILKQNIRYYPDRSLKADPEYHKKDLNSYLKLFGMLLLVSLSFRQSIFPCVHLLKPGGSD